MRHNNKTVPHVSIVIPTLNEGSNIDKLLDGIREEMRDEDFEVVVVDGGSEDDTVSKAKRLGARVMYDYEGKGSSLVRGLRSARGDVLVSMDADLSHRPLELRLLIDGIDIGYDVCMGSRFIAGGGTDDMPLLRRLGNKFFVLLVNVLFHSNYSDLCYGYRSFRRTALSKLRLREKGFGIETEINIEAVKRHLRVIEVPSKEKKRNAGTGKLRTFSDGYVILGTIVRSFIG